MKFFIGKVIGTIGAYLWEKGGWTGNESYEDLTVTGKIGFRMFFKGMNLMGRRPLTLKKYINVK